ncbi:hypothetical protein R3P38DRAFT_3359050 [Favolaschia claudopus]|uniref:Uncharacterized protein n=1 Tax=Favolaschia claudopus TaxID=2862362 RepID=A0AAW0B0V2_9AGAR
MDNRISLSENASLTQTCLSFFEDDRRSGRRLADEDWFARRSHRASPFEAADQSGFCEPRQREDVEESRSALAAIINTERIVWKQLYTRRDRLFQEGVSQLRRNRGGLTQLATYIGPSNLANWETSLRRSKARPLISGNAGLDSAALTAKCQRITPQAIIRNTADPRCFGAKKPPYIRTECDVGRLSKICLQNVCKGDVLSAVGRLLLD